MDSLEDPALMSSWSFFPSKDLMSVSSLSLSASIPTVDNTLETSVAPKRNRVRLFFRRDMEHLNSILTWSFVSTEN